MTTLQSSKERPSWVGSARQRPPAPWCSWKELRGPWLSRPVTLTPESTLSSTLRSWTTRPAGFSPSMRAPGPSESPLTGSYVNGSRNEVHCIRSTTVGALYFGAQQKGHPCIWGTDFWTTSNWSTTFGAPGILEHSIWGTRDIYEPPMIFEENSR